MEDEGTVVGGTEEGSVAERERERERERRQDEMGKKNALFVVKTDSYLQMPKLSSQINTK